MARYAPILALAAGLMTAAPLPAQDVQFRLTTEDTDLRRDLRQVSLVAALAADGTGTPQDIVAAAQADYRRMLTGLYAQGYYGGSVSILIDGREAASLAPLDAPTSIGSVDIRITPGPRFTFGRAEVGPLAPGTDLPENFRPGAIARSDMARAAAIAAVDGWRDAGHAKAAPDSQDITAIHAEDRLDVSIGIAPGPRLTFGPLIPTGNVAVRTERIVEIAGLPEGTVFSPEEVLLAAQRLRRTGAFSAVTLNEAEDYTADFTLPITAQVSEEKPRRFGFGVEYSTVEGFGLSGYWMHRNLLGGAENLRVEAEISGLGGETGGTDYRLAADFRRPGTLHPDNDLLIGASIERLDEPDFFLDQIAIEAGFARRVSEQRIASGAIGFVAATVEDDLGSRSYQLLTLPLTGTEDRRDDPLDPSSGFYLSLDITPFLGFGDAGSGARVFADGRAYRSFGADDRVTLAFRGQLGSIIGTGLSDSPSDYLFYSGGGDTVRGQPYQSLAIDLGGGNEIGGLSFAAASVEARVDVTDKFGLVGFYDAGFVGDTATPFESGEWHAGAGIGIRYDTGLGPIRVDLATPVTGPDAGGSLSFYVGIGQAF